MNLPASQVQETLIKYADKLWNHNLHHKLTVFTGTRKQYVPGIKKKILKYRENWHHTCLRNCLKCRWLQQCSGAGHCVFFNVPSLKSCDVRLPNVPGLCPALIQVDCINLTSLGEMLVNCSGFVLHSFLLQKETT